MDSLELSGLATGDLIVLTVEKGGGMRTLGAEVLTVHPLHPPGPRGKPGKPGKLRIRLYDADLYSVRSSQRTLQLEEARVRLGEHSAKVRLPNPKERQTIEWLKRKPESPAKEVASEADQ